MADFFSYTDGDHRRRLEAIATCTRAIRRALRTHLVTGYVPGHCTYNLCEYPSTESWEPDERDERELDALRDAGVGLVQLHEEWNDSQRLYGADKLSPVNPAGFRRFLDMAHRRGLKVLAYASTGFFSRRDPDFRPAWAEGADLVELYFDYAHCSPASPSWRGYLLPRLGRLLDDWGLDGIYNDLGYVQPGSDPSRPAADAVPAFAETPSSDGALGDLLALVYAEVKRRGGIVKVHRGGTTAPATRLKVYDYLWVGEGGGRGDEFREATKDFAPYVTPCLDMSRSTLENEDELYLHAIPYLQFPLLLGGRPFTGERAVVPGIAYPPEERCFWTRHCRAILAHYREHPEGPHSYGWWDSVPGRPEARPTFAKWLARYLPLVEEGTWAWLEVADSDLTAGSLPPGVVLSAFANRDLWLVLANYGRAAATVETREAYAPADGAPGPPRRRWELAPRSLTILRRC